MNKASKYLLLFGISLAIVAAVGAIFFTVIFFIIQAPSSRDFIINGLQKGTIVPIGGSTLEEQCALIQRLFLILGFIIMFVFLLLAASITFSILFKNTYERKFWLLAFIFSCVTLNVLNIIGYIFKYKTEEF